MLRSTTKFVLRLAVGVGLLVLVFQFVDAGDALHAMQTLDARWLAASAACYVATRVLMATKWWVLLGGRTAAISYPTVQRALCLSDYYSLLFPNTLAVDVTRVVLLRNHKKGAGFMAAAILADRVINVAVTASVSLLALAVAYLIAGELPFSPAVAYGVVVIALLVIAVAAVAASDRVLSLVTGALRALGRGSPRVQRWIDIGVKVHSAMATMLTSRGTVLPAIGLASATVLARVGSIYFLFIAVGAPQPFALLSMLVPIITLVALLPISVLGLGVKDGAFVFFFGGAGVAASVALAVSLTSYAVIIAGSVLLGLVASIVGPPLPKVESAAAAPIERNSR